jgi:hypothetical protein
MVTKGSRHCKPASDSATNHIAACQFYPIYFRLQACLMILTQIDSFAVSTEDSSTVPQINAVNLVASNETTYSDRPRALSHFIIPVVII